MMLPNPVRQTKTGELILVPPLRRDVRSFNAMEQQQHSPVVGLVHLGCGAVCAQSVQGPLQNLADFLQQTKTDI